MTFKQFFFLHEANYNAAARTAELSPEQFAKLYNANCSQYDPHNNIIYRGIRNFVAEYGFNDPTQMERAASNGKSFFMWLIESYPSWQNYPKRSRSIIATTSETYASQYGKAYYVIPYNGVKLGVCVGYDFFQSFFDEDVMVPEINNFLIDMIKYAYFTEKQTLNVSPQILIPDRATFLKYMKNLDKNIKRALMKDKPDKPSLEANSAAIRERYAVRNALNFNITDRLEEDFAPQKHGFQLLSLNQYNQTENPIMESDVDPGNEVWFSHPSLLVACQEGKTLAEILSEIGIK